MKSTKNRLISLLLACTMMIFGLASAVWAADEQIVEFNDIGDQSQAAQTAIMKLAVLGVVEGSDGLGGPFRPAENLTRAEFAKIVCYLTGNVKIAESLATVGSKFTDVSTGNWYTGWVNAAAQSGYFVGDPGGTFRPNANITMQEVVTAVLRAAGYTDKLPGAWPGNYVTKATNVGLLDDVTFVGSAPATRADMAIICDAVLGVNMVEYIDNEIAAGLGQTEGTVDKDGFSEVHRISNETDGNVVETILHKAFKGEYHTVQFATAPAQKKGQENYDEVAAWSYKDFASGELRLHPGGAFTGANFKTVLEGGYTSAADLASSYYITGGFGLPELAAMQAEITVIDNKEVCFVEVYSSYQTASSIYLDSGRVTADGKSYRASETMGVANNITNVVDYTAGYPQIQGLTSSNSDNDFGGKIYLDKDGRVYATKNYNAYPDTPFGIFDKIDSNVANWKNAYANFGELETNKDYVIYKGGEFIKAGDLNENDLVSYLGDSLGVKFYVVSAPLDDELTNQTASTLTLAGSSYRVVTGFQYSEDGGETFNGFNLTTDEVEFGTAEYAMAYNFTCLAYVAANISNITGVIIKIEPTLVPGTVTIAGTPTWGSYPQYQAVTIYNAEGKEVTYTFSRDFRDGYNWMMNGNAATAGALPSAANHFYANNTASATFWNAATADRTSYVDPIPAGVGLTKGSFVQLVLNKSDQVKKITHYSSFDTSGLKRTVTVQPSNSRITFNNSVFTLDKDTTVFNVTPTAAGDYNGVSVEQVASKLAANFDAYKVVGLAKTSNSITVLYIVSADTTTGNNGGSGGSGGGGGGGSGGGAGGSVTASGVAYVLDVSGEGTYKVHLLLASGAVRDYGINASNATSYRSRIGSFANYQVKNSVCTLTTISNTTTQTGTLGSSAITVGSSTIFLFDAWYSGNTQETYVITGAANVPPTTAALPIIACMEGGTAKYVYVDATDNNNHTATVKGAAVTASGAVAGTDDYAGVAYNAEFMLNGLDYQTFEILVSDELGFSVSGSDLPSLTDGNYSVTLTPGMTEGQLLAAIETAFSNALNVSVYYPSSSANWLSIMLSAKDAGLSATSITLSSGTIYGQALTTASPYAGENPVPGTPAEVTLTFDANESIFCGCTAQYQFNMGVTGTPGAATISVNYTARMTATQRAIAFATAFNANNTVKSKWEATAAGGAVTIKQKTAEDSDEPVFVSPSSWGYSSDIYYTQP